MRWLDGITDLMEMHLNIAMQENEVRFLSQEETPEKG